MNRMPPYEARLVRASVFVWIGLLCLFGSLSSPGLQDSRRPLLFVVLLALHLALHWIMLYRSVPPRRHLAYFVVQTGLVVGIGLAQPYITLTLGLFAILAGQAAAYGWTSVRLAALIGAFVALLALIASATVERNVTLFTPLWASPFILLVVAVVRLYQRQIRARDHAEAVVAELNQAHVELKQAHEQLRAYADQVEDLTLLAERQRIARELHDTLAQGLAGVILQLEAAQAHLADGRTARAGEIVQHAMVRARTALANSRRTIDNLRGERPTRDEFAAALRAEVERFTAATALECQLELHDLPALSEPVQQHALRAVAECLANVARHARARQVWLRIAHEDHQLLLDVRDDGVGFDPAAIGRQRGHYGLLGLYERAQLTGGSLDITSAPGAGTRVRLRMPLRSEVAA